MNDIKNHPESVKYFIVWNPSEAVIEKAQSLVKGGWAKVQDGTIICHNNFKDDFLMIIEKENRLSTVAPKFDNDNNFLVWIDENIQGKFAFRLEEMTLKEFNEELAGKTVEYIEDYLDY